LFVSFLSNKEAMMQFTDSHCHLDFSAFDANLSQLLQQCDTNNIHRIIVPAVKPSHWQRVISLTEKITPINITCSLGFHPWFVIQQDINLPKNYDVASQELKLKQAIIDNHSSHQNKIVAIGECGIDICKAKTSTRNEDEYNKNIQLQEAFFEMQLGIAKENNLPVIIHHCQSHPLILALLKQYKLANAGVIHAFSGSYQQAKDYVNLGFKLGIGGTITYPRAKKTIDAVKRLPLSSLLLETDAPSMPPFGTQGSNNSPLNVLAVFQALSVIRDEPATMIAAQIEHNV
jgi:TatD DNase family protein